MGIPKRKVNMRSFSARLFGTLFFFLLISLTAFSQETEEEEQSIYNQQQPHIVNLWHRVGDFSPTLRSVEAAEISADGRYVVSGAKFGYAVMLWRAADGFLLWEKEHESEVECVMFSPDGKRIATGGEDFYLRIWDTESGEEIAKVEHASGIDGINWSHDGQIIATGDEEGNLSLWDADSYRLLRKLNVGSTINSIQFTTDDQKILVGGNIQRKDENGNNTMYDGFAKLLDASTLKTLKQYEGPEGSVKSVRMSNNEKYVATGDFDRKARLFDLETGELLHTFYEPEKIEAVAFSPDNAYLLTGGHDNQINFYRMSDFQKAYSLETVRTEYIDFSKDGRLLLTAHEDSGLLSLYLMVSNTNRIPGLYDRLSREILNNRDMQ
jgi:WD40 repeat protein